MSYSDFMRAVAMLRLDYIVVVLACTNGSGCGRVDELVGAICSAIIHNTIVLVLVFLANPCAVRIINGYRLHECFSYDVYSYLEKF